MEKKCNQCKKTKHISEFGKDKNAKDKHCYQCKECRNANLRENHKKNPEIRKKINEKNRESRKKYYSNEDNKKKYKNDTLKQTYGISLDDYYNILKEQDGCCGICRGPQISSRNKYFAVDHCHQTGRVRGLLCDRCNIGIGCLNDDIGILQLAILYLEKYNNEHSV